MGKKRIEDTIHTLLKGDTQRNALRFIAFLREKGIPIEESDNYWDIAYRGKSVCFIWINGSDAAPGPWTIWSDQEPGSFASWPDENGGSEGRKVSVDEHTKAIAWAHVNFCADCGGDCSPGKNKTVLGKEFRGVCQSTMAFTDPDAEELKCAMNMVEMRLQDLRAR